MKQKTIPANDSLSATGEIKTSFPIRSTAQIMGFHMEIATAVVGGRKVRITGGFGLGNAGIHIYVDEKCVLTVDSSKALKDLIAEGIARHDHIHSTLKRGKRK